MIGLVIVSHSRPLAEGIRDLAQHMTKGKSVIAIAAGIDGPAGVYGVDDTQILQAIESVYSDDGVIVFIDLGSTITAAETALGYFPDHQKENIHLCEAPLVEGVLSAAVQAAGGNTIDDVIDEARGALEAKALQLGIDISRKKEDQNDWNIKESTQEIVLTIRNKMGLHARPAAQFVSTANRFTSEIFIKNLSKNTDFVNAKSINQIITLGVRHGHQIMIASAGPDATDSIISLKKLIDTNFNEEQQEFISLPLKPRAGDTEARRKGNTLSGIPVSPGIAIGPAYFYRPVIPDIPEFFTAAPDTELNRFLKAIREVRNDIEELLEESTKSMEEYDASIFEAHLLYLNDPALIDRTRDVLTEQQINAEAAWQSVIQTMINSYKSHGDDLVRDREVDLIDIGSQVISKLTGKPRTYPDPHEPSIVLTKELNPSETARLKKDKILALCSERGNKTSHSAIMARSLGIPAVFGIGPDINHIKNDSELIVDGSEGTIIIDPDPETIRGYRERQEKEFREKTEARSKSMSIAVTTDGVRVGIGANVSDIDEIRTGLANGAEGVGLFRTEFLYMNRSSAPGEDEQYKVYKEAADILGNRPLIFRTLDIGGDKPIPYLNIKKESNPFLGRRGIRYCLDEVGLFKTQLRAILRASHERNISVMFPMVTIVRELRAAQTIVMEVKNELAADSIPFNDTIRIGAMIEVPSAVVNAAFLIKEVDFFSIGTNDLIQYTFAADRTNSNVVSLGDPLDPAILKMIRDTIQASHTAGKWTGICGEMAGDLNALPVLLGLGIDEFSMSPAVISDWKELLRKTSSREANHLAEKALRCSSADEVKELSTVPSHRR